MRTVKVLAFVIVGLLVAVPAAEAKRWYSADSPLYVSHDGTKHAKAYGNFKNHNGVSARSVSQQYDMRPGGNKVFVNTRFYWYYTVCGSSGCKTSYHLDTEKQTDRTSKAEWVKDYTARYLHATATRARGQMKVCVDRPWKPDWCSAKVYRSFNY